MSSIEIGQKKEAGARGSEEGAGASAAVVGVAASPAGIVVVVAAALAGFFAVPVPPVAVPPREALPSSSSLFLSPSEELALSNAVPSVWAVEAFLLLEGF